MPTDLALPPHPALPRLQDELRALGLDAQRAGDVLLFRRNGMTTRISLIPPRHAPDGAAIPATLTVETRLPERMASLILAPDIVDAMNQQAALGALVAENGDYILGTRLSIGAGETAMEVAARLARHAATAALDAILKEDAHGAMLREPAPIADPAAWAPADFVAAADVLSMFAPAAANWPRLTASFALKPHPAPAEPDTATATWTLDAARPHPVLGAGLACRLDLPHTIAHRARLLGVLNRLNGLEMQPEDLPPFLGAWCAGPGGDTPCHVMFLPNTLADCPALATTVSVWAYMRAQWANAMLATMAIHPSPRPR